MTPRYTCTCSTAHTGGLLHVIIHRSTPMVYSTIQRNSTGNWKATFNGHEELWSSYQLLGLKDAHYTLWGTSDTVTTLRNTQTSIKLYNFVSERKMHLLHPDRDRKRGLLKHKEIGEGTSCVKSCFTNNFSWIVCDKKYVALLPHWPHLYQKLTNVLITTLHELKSTY